MKLMSARCHHICVCNFSRGLLHHISDFKPQVVHAYNTFLIASSVAFISCVGSEVIGFKVGGVHESLSVIEVLRPETLGNQETWSFCSLKVHYNEL